MILSRTATGKVLMLESILTDESKQTLLNLPKPRTLLGKEVPTDLNEITIGQLSELQEAVKSENMRTIVTESARILLGVAPLKVLRHRADHTIGFAVWVLHELERIAKMWKAIELPTSPEAIQAGAEQMDTDSFDLVDWYALRMGIADHEEAMSVPWVRVWRCMKKDNQNSQFQQRLREIYAKQSTKK
jgi:hypothetical protein